MFFRSLDIPSFRKSIKFSINALLGHYPTLQHESQFLFGSLVSDGYAKTLGVSVRAVREITEQEIAHGDHVGMMNETLAKLWPASENPIGRRVRLDALGKAAPGWKAPSGMFDPYITALCNQQLQTASLLSRK